eukprot:5674372-Amphidinium_carterae.2
MLPYVSKLELQRRHLLHATIDRGQTCVQPMLPTRGMKHHCHEYKAWRSLNSLQIYSGFERTCQANGLSNFVQGKLPVCPHLITQPNSERRAVVLSDLTESS